MLSMWASQTSEIAQGRVEQGCSFSALLDLEIANGSPPNIDSRFSQVFTLKRELSWPIDRVLPFYLFSQVDRG
jgi:hypothetical protein